MSSWKDKLENIQFTIKTGDGKEYFPLWKSGEKSKEFNTTIFDFIDVKGSLVERKQAKSGKYPLTFWFQGDDNIEQSEAFEKSAEDNRYWTVTHPFYGTIKGQPISITRNDQNYNITEITVDFWESIVFDYPKSNLSIQDNTLVKKELIFENCATAYSSKKIFTAEDINKNKTAIANVSKEFEGLQNNDTFAEYQNTVNKALKASDNLIGDSFNAIFTAQQTLNIPENVNQSVKNRISAYVSAFNNLVGVLESVPDKLFFQSMGGACISALCDSSVNYRFGEDYVTVSEVEFSVSKILEIYELYLKILDDNSTSSYDIENSFKASAIVQSDLSNLVMFTVSNLYKLAFEAQQERIVYTPKDTNLILLTHKYLGLDASDENINNFRMINNIKLKELFRVKKGRRIVYYV